MPNARIVDEDVQPAKTRHGFGNHGLPLRFVRAVMGHRVNGIAQFCCQRIHRVTIDIGRDHFRPLRDKGTHCGLADPATRAGHDSNFATQPVAHNLLSSFAWLSTRRAGNACYFPPLG